MTPPLSPPLLPCPKNYDEVLSKHHQQKSHKNTHRHTHTHHRFFIFLYSNKVASAKTNKKKHKKKHALSENIYGQNIKKKPIRNRTSHSKIANEKIGWRDEEVRESKKVTWKNYSHIHTHTPHKIHIHTT